MRYLIAVFIMIFSGTQVLAQQYEVGPFLGGANYIGDIGNSSYINPQTPVAGALFKYNASSRHSYRLSVMLAALEADDADSHDLRRQERGYSFSNTLAELSAGLEFSFWEFDLNSSTKQGTPYLYTGLNYYFAHHLEAGPEGGIVEDGKTGAFSIPLALGYKHKLNSFLTGGIELGARYAFTDNLDGSHPMGEETGFGNPNTNDWYVFTGIYISFYFGRPDCYNNFE